MIRTLFFFVLLGFLIVVAVWLADWGGLVAFDLPAYAINLFGWRWSWPGYRIEAPIGVVVLAVALVAAVLAFVYRLWLAITAAPGGLGRRAQEKRRARGYQALSQGMAAVAAGDSAEALKLARKAESLLHDPPLTLLLSAQAAQLDGDDQAAQRYFTAMLEREETRFMGLRGLVMLALREGDRESALIHLRQAHQLRPKTPWVLTAMVELAEANGDLITADKAIKDAVRHKALPAPEGSRKRAIVLLERADAAAASDTREATKLAREAHKLAPDLVPATARLAKLLIAGNKSGEAARILERSWAESPHPDLAACYRAAKPPPDGLKGLTQMRKLVAGAATHPASLVVLAEAALEAELWGEARRYLNQAIELSDDSSPNETLCRLMARLEEAEHGDAEKARDWLIKAAAAPRGPAWACESCGAEAERWGPHCGNCDAFATLAWRSPKRVAPSPAAVTGPAEVTPKVIEGGLSQSPAAAPAAAAETVIDAELEPPARAAAGR